MKIVPRILALGISIAFPLLASEECPKNHINVISVSGSSEVSAVPDQMSITLAVSEQAKDIKALTQLLESKTTKILSAVEKYVKEPQNIQTSNVNIQAIYGKEEDGKKLLNLEAIRTIKITLVDLGKFDSLLSACIEAGANRVTNTSLEIKDPSVLKRKALAQAMKAAQEKAVLLASSINQSIGKAINIREGSSNNTWGSAAANSYLIDGIGTTGSGSLSIGMIKIHASVTVEFELK